MKSFYELAEEYNKSEKYNEALKAINSAIDSDKNNPSFYKLRAEILNHLGRWDLAKKDEEYILECITQQIKIIKEHPKEYEQYKKLEELQKLRSYSVLPVKNNLEGRLEFKEYSSIIDRQINKLYTYIEEIEQYIKIFESFYMDFKGEEIKKYSDIVNKRKEWWEQVKQYKIRIEEFSNKQTKLENLEKNKLNKEIKNDESLKKEKQTTNKKRKKNEIDEVKFTNFNIETLFGQGGNSEEKKDDGPQKKKKKKI